MHYDRVLYVVPTVFVAYYPDILHKTLPAIQ